MSRAATKTNNSHRYVEDKIKLRVESLPRKRQVKVLEMFGGEGLLWKSVKSRCPGKEIDILSIDKNKYDRVQLKGDNLKFIGGMNLKQFDVIDIDAWGIPIAQLEEVFRQQFKGVVHVTLIRQHLASLPKEILQANDIPYHMYRKCRTIFSNKADQLIDNYLFSKGIRKIRGIRGAKETGHSKNYFWFEIE